jgi:hypothetical protein
MNRRRWSGLSAAVHSSRPFLLAIAGDHATYNCSDCRAQETKEDCGLGAILVGFAELTPNDCHGDSQKRRADKGTPHSMFTDAPGEQCQANRPL